MKKLFFPLVLFLGFVLSANAQTASVKFERVTYDSTNIGFASTGYINFRNANTSVFSRLQDGNFGPGNCVCFAGHNLSLVSSYGGELSITGGFPGLVNDTVRDKIYFTGQITLDGGSYLLPYRYSRQPFTIILPATLTGSVNGFPLNPFSTSSTPLFTSTLNLSGTVTVNLEVDRLGQVPNGGNTGVPHYKINRVSYDFSESANLNEIQEQSEKDEGRGQNKSLINGS